MPAQITAAAAPPFPPLASLSLSVTLVAIRRKLRFLPNRKAKSHGIGRGEGESIRGIDWNHTRMRLDPTFRHAFCTTKQQGVYL